jgi:hypothetical protein
VPNQILRELSVAATAVLSILATAGPVAAECSVRSPSHAIAPYVGYAFTATVTSVSRNPTQRKRGNAAFDWEVRLEVLDTYRGSVPESILLDGWFAGCGWFSGSQLDGREVLFVSTGSFYLPTLAEDLLVWRRTPTGWTFDYETDSPHDGGGPGFFPPAAERATTLAQILAVVDRGNLPGTDAIVGSLLDPDPGLAWLLMGPALIGFLGIWRRRRPRSSDGQALMAETTIRRRRSMASPSMMPADSSWASASSR